MLTSNWSSSIEKIRPDFELRRVSLVSGDRSRHEGTVTQGDVSRYTFKDPDKRPPNLIATYNSAVAVLASLTIGPITTGLERAQIVTDVRKNRNL